MIGEGIVYGMISSHAFNKGDQSGRRRYVLDIPGRTTDNISLVARLIVIPGMDRSASLFQLAFASAVIGPIRVGEQVAVFCHRFRLHKGCVGNVLLQRWNGRRTRVGYPGDGMDLIGMITICTRIGLAAQISVGSIAGSDIDSARYTGPGQSLKVVISKSFGFIDRTSGVFSAGEIALLVVPGQLIVLNARGGVGDREAVGIGDR